MKSPDNPSALWYIGGLAMAAMGFVMVVAAILVITGVSSL